MAKQKNKTVTTSNDGNYKLIQKSKITNRGESSSIKERRTVKGLLSGAARTSKANRYEGREAEGAPGFFDEQQYFNKKGGSVKKKKKK